MPRHKQVPKRIQVGEGAEGEQLAGKEAAERNEDEEEDERQPRDEKLASDEAELDSEDEDDDDQQPASSPSPPRAVASLPKPSRKPHLPSSPASSSSSASPQDLKPLVPVKSEPLERAKEDAGSPLDFSIKSSTKSAKRGPAGFEEQRDETGEPKKAKKESSSVSFPLDLSVKRSSHAFPPPMKREYGLANKYGRPDAATPPKSLTPPHSHGHGGHRGASHSPLSIPQHPANGPEKMRAAYGGKSMSATTGLISRGGGSSSHGRQNPWQTQWINRSSEQTRDVFTCVWCKESFRSLQEMTVHMKESPRCGMAGMQQAAANAASASSLSASPSTPSAATSGSTPPAHSGLGPHRNGSAGRDDRDSRSAGSGKEPMSSAVLAKNNVNLPRKLVRGQDVWLGRGAEQTRQILKCMWCGQSFKTLDDMTRHMRVTQHYTNIISQEQIISWRTPEDKLAQAQVNAVLTCKVCDEAFGSLKELSYHMVKNAHYKEHILRSITEGGHGRRRQTRERRKKSLPVRKLLELERMEMTPTSTPSSGPSSAKDANSHTSGSSKHSSSKKERLGGVDDRDLASSKAFRGLASAASLTSIPCDECGEKVEAKHYISHIKSCKAGSKSLQTDARSPSSSTSESHLDSGPPSRSQTASPPAPPSKDDKDSDEDDDGDASGHEGSAKSPQPQSSSFFLSAMESLIEKFDTKGLKKQRRSSGRSEKGSEAASERSAVATSSPTRPVSCDDCGEKIDANHFISHIKACKGVDQLDNLRSPGSSTTGSWSECGTPTRSHTATPPKERRKEALDDSDGEDMPGPERTEKADKSFQRHKSSSERIKAYRSLAGLRVAESVSPAAPKERRVNGKLDDGDLPLRDGQAEEPATNGKDSQQARDKESPKPAQSSHFLSALEQLIEKSFDSKSKKNPTTGILQRLGIDEEACPPWHHIVGQGFEPLFQPWAMPLGRDMGSASPSPGASSVMSLEANKQATVPGKKEARPDISARDLVSSERLKAYRSMAAANLAAVACDDNNSD